ncbi:MAG: hypothetical protein MJE12_07215 [Alphaproteobacteria bacterium]|nr:hypothetical protein [Alphaproteobacteria bacterium]
MLDADATDNPSTAGSVNSGLAKSRGFLHSEEYRQRIERWSDSFGCVGDLIVAEERRKMASDGERRSGESWNPSLHAVSFERYEHPIGRGPETIVVSHPTVPFVKVIDDAGPDGLDQLEDGLQRSAFTYLLKLKEFLGKRVGKKPLLPPEWENALDPKRVSPGGDFFGWLPLDRPVDDEGDKKSAAVPSSYLIQREMPSSNPDKAKPQTAVMVASETLPLDDGTRPINSGFGLQVVMNLTWNGDQVRASISSMTEYLPYGSYSTLVEQPEPIGKPLYEHLDIPPDEFFARLKSEFASRQLAIIRRAVLDEAKGLSVDKLRFVVRADDNSGDVGVFLETSGHGIAALSSGPFSTTHRVTARFPIFGVSGSSDASIELVENVPLVANQNAQGHARIFDQDPVSLERNAPRPVWDGRRPTGQEDFLDQFRDEVEIGNSADCQLAFPGPGGAPIFLVRNCPGFVHGDPDTLIKTVSLPQDQGPRVREDDHSAVSAFHNFREIFTLLNDRFGFDPDQYLHAITRPIHIFYRSGIIPGPGRDGKTINAQVRPQRTGSSDTVADLSDPEFLESTPLRVEIHLALANHSHRARWIDPANPQPTWAEPLGIATSERWMWHEFSHVLIAGRFRRLEFQFAHSFGDALAAVYADPFSRLANAEHETREGNVQKNFRGFTFPWVFLNRRHDRCVLNGWSWSGTLQRPVTESPEYLRDNYKGYLSEQILSSTLFRLYRVLGGDTTSGDADSRTPDYDTRETASLVALYLTIDSIGRSGLPPQQAEVLEGMMIDADSGLSNPLTLQLRSGVNHAWQGGLAHKVIRWAFEAQGMHAPDPDQIHNAPGAPPPVDIYIEDQRPREEITDHLTVEHGPGGYPPVSLDWSGERRWTAGNFDRNDLGSLRPIIRNRGHEAATGVSARIWLGRAQNIPPGAGWDRAQNITWFFAAAIPLARDTVEPGETLEIVLNEIPSGDEPASPDAAGYVLLIEVSCADDRANSDPTDDGLPCAIPLAGMPPDIPRQLSDLVANDNNLALWVTW